jgi:dTDP-4-amino-4,6-dideoxygalactose transaminase
VSTQASEPDAHSARHLYVIRLRLEKLSIGRLEVFLSLRSEGIGVNVHYLPVHLHPYYARLGFKRNDFPEAERHYAEAISLPMFPTLTREQQSTVIGALAETLRAVTAA